jgi:hypothetical protein
MRLLLLGILVLLPGSAVAQALVTIEANGSLGQISNISLNGVFSGLAADIIEITDDEPDVNLRFDGGYNISFSISVEGRESQISALLFKDYSNSESVKELSGPISVKTHRDQDLDRIFSIELYVPELRDTGKQRSIALPYMIAPRQRAAIVSSSYP